MQLSSSLVVLFFAALAIAAPAPRRGRGGRGRNRGGAAAGGAAAGGAAAGGAAAGGAGTATTTTVAAPPAETTAATNTTTTTDATTAVRGAQTLVFDEVNGVPGNTCLTFRNNGEIVDAACVLEAADRQLTPSTLGPAPVLLVQRSFSAGFRPDLVDVQACVGNNGTHFLALPCAGLADPVSFDAATGTIVSAKGACQSGHDGAAQVTVDQTGADCATFKTNVVTPTAP